MNSLLARTVDLETTDFVENNGVPIEAGYVDSFYTRSGPDAAWRCTTPVHDMKQSFFHPGDAPCSIDARATHHIKDSELVDAPHHSTLKEWIVSGPVCPTIFVAHNADFEKAYIDAPEGSWWIDTYKVALRLYPDFPRHTNQYLRYALGLELADEYAMPPHRALPDAYTTAHILAHMVESGVASLKEMAVWSVDLPYLTRVGFGEHFGKKFTELPIGYLRWILTKDFEPAVLAATERALRELAS